MATTKIVKVERLKDQAGNLTGRVGIMFEIGAKGLWRFSHSSPPVYVTPDGYVRRMTPAEHHIDHVAQPIAVGSPQAYWFVWDAEADQIDLLRWDVTKWGFKIPLVNIMYGIEWAGSEPVQVDTVEIGESDTLATKPSTPSAAPGFSEDPTWGPSEKPGDPVGGAVDDEAGSAFVGEKAPGVPDTRVAREPSRNHLAQAPNTDIDKPSFSAAEPGETPTFAPHSVPDSKQKAPDIPQARSKVGTPGSIEPVNVPARRSGTRTKIPNQGSRVASLDPVPLVNYDGKTEGNAFVGTPEVEPSSDAQLILIAEPRVIPVGQFALLSVLIKNRSAASTLTNVGVHVEVLLKSGQRRLMLNTPREITLEPGGSTTVGFHFEARQEFPVGMVRFRASLVSSDGQPMASVQSNAAIAPENWDPWAMGSSGPTQFTDKDRLPAEVLALIESTSNTKAEIPGSFYEHGRPQVFVVTAKSDRLTAAVQINGAAKKAGMSVRLRIGKMGGNSPIMGTYVESSAPLKFGELEVIPGSHEAALGFSSFEGVDVESGQDYWISVEPTAPISDPVFNFLISVGGAALKTVQNNTYESSGIVAGELTLPWRNTFVALTNRRTTAAILLNVGLDGSVDVSSTWPVNQAIAALPGDVLEVRHGGYYNSFSKVHTTFDLDDAE